MKFVKLFEAWTEEKEEEVSHQQLWEMLEELVNAWKEWKENDDEDRDEEELHDEFMRKVEDLIERAKEIVEEEEEEEEGDEESSEPSEYEEETETETEESSGEETEETEETEEIEEAREDLSKREGSLSWHLERLIPVMHTMDLPTLKDSLMQLLNSPDLKASPATRNKWMEVAMNSVSRKQLMETIKNIYLRGSGLGSNPDDYKGSGRWGR